MLPGGLQDKFFWAAASTGGSGGSGSSGGSGMDQETLQQLLGTAYHTRTAAWNQTLQQVKALYEQGGWVSGRARTSAAYEWKREGRRGRALNTHLWRLVGHHYSGRERGAREAGRRVG